MEQSAATDSGIDTRPSQRRQRKSWRRRISFSIVVLLLNLALIELCAWGTIHFFWGGRAALYRQREDALALSLETTQMESGMNVDIHPYMGSGWKPGRKSWNGHRSNEYGFASSWPTLRKRAPDTVIVGITGGSVAEQFCLTDTLRPVLKGYKEFNGKRIELVQLAVGGHKQPQQLMTLAYILSLGGELDILINIDGFNEAALPVQENIPHGVFAAYPRAWHTMLPNAADRDVLRAIAAVSTLRERRKRRAQAIEQSVLRHSLTANFVWLLADRADAHSLDEAQQQLRVLMRREGNPIVSGPREKFADEQAMYAHLAAIWRDSSIQMAGLCRANGLRYFHFLQPNQYLPDSKPMSEEEKKIATQASWAYQKPIATCYPKMRAEGETLRKQGVAFFDLTQLFADHPETIYRDKCCHYNARGDQLLAEAISRRIVESMRDEAQ